MDLEVRTKNKITGQERFILLREIPDDTTVAEFKSQFRIYAGPDEEILDFGKVVFENANEQIGVNDGR